MLRSRGHARGGIVLSCTALVSALAMASAASAAEFNWSPTAATSPNGAFTYQVGKNIGISDLLGSPAIIDTSSTAGFEFNTGQTFVASGGGGSAGLANNIASTLIISGTQGPINAITIREFGTWLAPGGEAPEDIFNFTLILGLAPISPGGAQQFSALSDTIDFNPDGTWTAEGTLVPNAGFFMIGSITAENILGVEAIATAGSTFTKLGSTLLIPEPTTVALLLAGLGPLALRRRRRNS